MPIYFILGSICMAIGCAIVIGIFWVGGVIIVNIANQFVHLFCWLHICDCANSFVNVKLP